MSVYYPIESVNIGPAAALVNVGTPVLYSSQQTQNKNTHSERERER